MTVAVQINGKLRDTVEVERDIEQERAEGAYPLPRKGSAPPPGPADKKGDRRAQ